MREFQRTLTLTFLMSLGLSIHFGCKKQDNGRSDRSPLASASAIQGTARFEGFKPEGEFLLGFGPRKSAAWVDNDTIIVGAYGGWLLVDARTGSILREERTSGTQVNAVAGCPAEKWTAVGTNSREIAVHLSTQDKPLFKAETDASVASLSFNPKCTRLAVGQYNGKLRLYEVPSGRLLASTGSMGADADVDLVSFTPDGSTVVAALRAGFGNKALYWRPATEGPNKPFAVDPQFGSVGSMSKMLFGRLGGVKALSDRLLAMTLGDGQVYLYDMETKALSGQFDPSDALGVGKGPKDIDLDAFAPDGRLAVASSSAVAVFECRDACIPLGKRQPRSEPGPVTFSPSGDLLLDARLEDPTLHVHAVDGETSRAIGTPTGLDWMGARFRFSKDGRRLATQSGQVWDVAAGTLVFAGGDEDSDSWKVAYSSDGKYIATGDHWLNLMDIEKQTVTRVEVSKKGAFNQWECTVMSLSFSERDSLLAVGDNCGRLLLFDVANGKTTCDIRLGSGSVMRSVFTDGDGTVLVYALQKNLMITTADCRAAPLPDDRVSPVLPTGPAIEVNGRRVADERHEAIRRLDVRLEKLEGESWQFVFWDTLSKKELGRATPPDLKGLSNPNFELSASGEYLAFGVSGTIVLWKLPASMWSR